MVPTSPCAARTATRTPTIVRGRTQSARHKCTSLSNSKGHA
ncbi:hypothetical protein SRHO_G00150180, partial [Serrasalmus rhombeus]